MHGAMFDPNASAVFDPEVTAMAGTRPSGTEDPSGGAAHGTGPIHDHEDGAPPMMRIPAAIRDEPKPPPPPIKFAEAQDDPLQRQAMKAPLAPKAVLRRGVAGVMKANAWKRGNKNGGDTTTAANALGTMTDVAMRALDKARADRRKKHNRKVKRQAGQPRNVTCRTWVRSLLLAARSSFVGSLGDIACPPFSRVHRLFASSPLLLLLRASFWLPTALLRPMRQALQPGDVHGQPPEDVREVVEGG